MTTTHTPTANRIVVGIDGSQSSKQALRWALYLATTLDCEVDAVAVWQMPAGWAASGGWTAVPVDWHPGEPTAKMLHDTVTEVLDGKHADHLRARTREGSAAHVLLEASRGARMLVVGSRGHGGFTGLLIGSVSQACAEHADCPVLVVHGDTAPPPVV